MTARRATTVTLAAAILLGIAALFFLRSSPTPAPTAPLSPPPAATPTVTQPSTLGAQPPADQPPASPIADALNAPDGTLRRDLEILNELFVAFHTNFPRLGNPVGENSEITAALLGDNPAQFPFLPRTHRALNARGELCDRWGTPFRFHQLSGTQMEIHSAGPDRKFGTVDDALYTP